MKSNVIQLVKNQEPPSRPARCLPFVHHWGKWRRVGGLFQERECLRCGKIKDRLI